MSMMVAPHRFAAIAPIGALNPLDTSPDITLSNSNRTATSTFSQWRSSRSITAHSAGRYYLEWTYNGGGDGILGFMDSAASLASYVGSSADSCGYRAVYMAWYGTAAGGLASAPVAGDIICVSINLNTRKFWVRLNGGYWNGSAGNDPVTGVGGASLGTSMTAAVYAAISVQIVGQQWTLNSGQVPFAQAMPSSDVAWG